VTIWLIRVAALKSAVSRFLVTAEKADRVPQSPRGRHAEDGVGAADRHGRCRAQPLGGEQPDTIHLVEQRGIHACDRPGGRLAARGDVGREDIGTVAQLCARMCATVVVAPLPIEKL
jgi:hypothetical protein